MYMRCIYVHVYIHMWWLCSVIRNTMTVMRGYQGRIGQPSPGFHHAERAVSLAEEAS